MHALKIPRFAVGALAISAVGNGSACGDLTRRNVLKDARLKNMRIRPCTPRANARRRSVT